MRKNKDVVVVIMSSCINKDSCLIAPFKPAMQVDLVQVSLLINKQTGGKKKERKGRERELSFPFPFPFLFLTPPVCLLIKSETCSKSILPAVYCPQRESLS